MIGVYVHIPFCQKKCNYCDFYSITDFSDAKKYTDAVISEIREFYQNNDEIADTIYFGGGTPTAIEPEFIGKILSEIKAAKNAEITIEANPKTFDSLQLMQYKKYGINRVSMGLQSAIDDELKLLGRIHSFADFLNSFEMLRNAGFHNINSDIMYGLPYSTEKTLEKTLSELVRLKCEHISAYALTLSKNTPLYKMDYKYPDDDEVFSQYELVNHMLNGYIHYEISNYASSDGKKSQHNMKYWTNKPYIGFGAGAHSYFGDKRWEIISDKEKYIAERKKENIQIIGKNDRYFEYIMLNLRLKEGIDLKYIKDEFDIDILEKYKNQIEKNMKFGYLIHENETIFLTEKGFFVSNSIISNFLN